jgi:hypothetical protein
MAEQLILKGTLEGHVRAANFSELSLATDSMRRAAGSPALRPLSRSTNPLPNTLGSRVLTASSPNMLLSGSRDKSLIIWNLTRDETQYGFPKRSLHGHSHIVSDCVCRKLRRDLMNTGADS